MSSAGGVCSLGWSPGVALGALSSKLLESLEKPLVNLIDVLQQG